MTEYQRWQLKEQDLEGLNPIRARDIIIKCFFEAQKETFERSKKLLDRPASDDDIYRSVVGAVKVAFDETGGDFEKPGRETLVKVVTTLARKAGAWGTPADIIEHHRVLITKVINLLKD